MKLTPQEVIQMLKDNKKIVAEFNEKIENSETCIDENMKGKIISCIITDDTYKHKDGRTEYVYKLRIDLSEFDKYNDAFMKHNYYDANGKPCLTCKGANMYPNNGVEEIYLSSYDNNVFDVFEIQEDNKHELYTQFLLDKTEYDYTKWLEEKLTKSNALVKELHNNIRQLSGMMR